MINTIVFDFGGILINLDSQGAFNNIKTLFKVPLEQAIPEEIQIILDQYEMGAFSEGSFMHRLQRLRPYIITERQLSDAWNSMLLELPKRRLDYLLELRKKYRILLLSNTNHTHIEWVRKYLKDQYDISNFETTYFDHVIYSHDIKLSKPGTAIYKKVAQDYNLNLKESIFIDDSLANIEGAQMAGWQAVRHNPSDEIIGKLESYLSRF